VPAGAPRSILRVDTPAASWPERVRQMPAGLRPYALDQTCDPARLASLDLPVGELPVAELAWQLDLPWWPDGGRPFAVTPRAVAEAPWRHREHHARTLAADLRVPIHVIRRRGRRFVLDGVHRLLKAELQGRATVAARELPGALLPLVAQGPARNDRRFVEDVLALLAHEGVGCWLFGGWAEELRGVAPPRAHRDVDLLHPAASFAAVDHVIAERGLAEIPAKRLPHKRAFELRGVMVEVLLVLHDARGRFTRFHGEQRHDWPADALGWVGRLPVAGPVALAGFRAAYADRRLAAAV
jgi:Aminoglycoside-2''-adenylyltransferase